MKPAAQARKLCITILGRDHRDFASSHALMHGMKAAFNNKRLQPANCVFGLERAYNLPNQITPSTPIFNQWIKNEGIDAFYSRVTPIMLKGADSTSKPLEARLSMIDRLAVYHMKDFCQQHGVKTFQLDSEAMNLFVDEKLKHHSLEKKEEALAAIDKIRMEKMMQNVQSHISGDITDVMFVVGGAHVPVLTAECLRFFKARGENVKVVPALMLSQQGAIEIGAPYPAALGILQDTIEKFTMRRMHYDKTTDSQAVMQAIRDMRVIKTSEEGLFEGRVFDEIISRSTAEFLPSPSTSPSKTKEKKFVSEERGKGGEVR
jgi:hypothetical protein